MPEGIQNGLKAPAPGPGTQTLVQGQDCNSVEESLLCMQRVPSSILGIFK